MRFTLAMRHQTGWTGCVARIMQLLAVTPVSLLEAGKNAATWQKNNHKS
jgi:hypothetical protein